MRYEENCGTAMAARIAMMATTIRSSIRVKPFCLFSILKMTLNRHGEKRGSAILLLLQLFLFFVLALLIVSQKKPPGYMTGRLTVHDGPILLGSKVCASPYSFAREIVCSCSTSSRSRDLTGSKAHTGETLCPV